MEWNLHRNVSQEAWDPSPHSSCVRMSKPLGFARLSLPINKQTDETEVSTWQKCFRDTKLMYIDYLPLLSPGFLHWNIRQNNMWWTGMRIKNNTKGRDIAQEVERMLTCSRAWTGLSTPALQAPHPSNHQWIIPWWPWVPSAWALSGAALTRCCRLLRKEKQWHGKHHKRLYNLWRDI